MDVRSSKSSDQGVFNIEGGCYAKCVGLDPVKEPEIYQAVRFGSVLENVRFKDPITREVDYNDTSITQNTRVSYPLDFIPGAKLPAVGGHPKNIIFLTSDANGVLPPISKLSSTQAMYHFISGYTANMAGVVAGDNDTSATFSACFGEAFLPRHPTLYAELLEQKIQKHNTNVWLLNTGWINGKYGVGTVGSQLIFREFLSSTPERSSTRSTTVNWTRLSTQPPMSSTSESQQQ